MGHLKPQRAWVLSLGLSGPSNINWYPTDWKPTRQTLHTLDAIWRFILHQTRALSTIQYGWKFKLHLICNQIVFLLYLEFHWVVRERSVWHHCHIVFEPLAQVIHHVLVLYPFYINILSRKTFDYETYQFSYLHWLRQGWVHFLNGPSSWCRAYRVVQAMHIRSIGHLQILALYNVQNNSLS